MSLLRGSLTLLSARVVAALCGLGIVLIAARQGPAVQGAFALFTAVESVLLLAGSGFSAALARRLSHERQDASRLVGTTLAVVVAAGLVFSLGVAGAVLVGEGLHDHLVPLAWTAPLLLVSPNLLGLWLGRGRLAGLAVLTTASPLLTLLALAAILVVQGGLRIEQVLWTWALTRAAVALATLFAVARAGVIGRPSRDELRRYGRFAVVIGLTNVIALLNYKVDLFVVEHYLGHAHVGVYSIAVLAAEALWMVSSSITQAAYADIGQPDPERARREALGAIQSSLVVLSLLAVPVALVVQWLVPRALGAAYAPVAGLVVGLLPGVVCYGAASGLSAWYTNHAGRPQWPAAFAGLSLLLNLATAVWLVPAWGAMGAAVATSVSYALAVLVSTTVFLRLSGGRWSELLRPQPGLWRALRPVGVRWRRGTGVRP